MLVDSDFEEENEDFGTGEDIIDVPPFKKTHGDRIEYGECHKDDAIERRGSCYCRLQLIVVREKFFSIKRHCWKYLMKLKHKVH